MHKQSQNLKKIYLQVLVTYSSVVELFLWEETIAIFTHKKYNSVKYLTLKTPKFVCKGRRSVRALVAVASDSLYPFSPNARSAPEGTLRAARPYLNTNTNTYYIY